MKFLKLILDIFLNKQCCYRINGEDIHIRFAAKTHSRKRHQSSVCTAGKSTLGILQHHSSNESNYKFL